MMSAQRLGRCKEMVKKGTRRDSRLMNEWTTKQCHGEKYTVCIAFNKWITTLQNKSISRLCFGTTKTVMRKQSYNTFKRVRTKTSVFAAIVLLVLTAVWTSTLLLNTSRNLRQQTEIVESNLRSLFEWSNLRMLDASTSGDWNYKLQFTTQTVFWNE